MVQHMTRSGLKIALLGLVLVVGLACANKSYIYVNYNLPPMANSLQGRSVFVQTNDLRRSHEIFNPRAKKAFESFTDLFSLSLIKNNGKPMLKGAYTLPMLFETALKERLQILGINVVEQPSADAPTLTIDLNQFNINLVGQKWIADISYEVSLTQDNQTVSREVVTGSAERVKLLGRGGAEKIMSEIFTEMINRLNVNRLFQQANL